MTQFTKILCITLFVFIAGISFPKDIFAGTTGFLGEMIEISDTSIVEGEEVELTIGFLNEEEKQLTGKINFYNSDELLGTRELNLAPGQEGEFVLTWKAVLGEHSFIARAENLKLEGSTVTILGTATEPKEVLIGFKNSSIAENLRERGGFGAIVAGVIDEVGQFFGPIIDSLDTWRLSKISPLEITQERIDTEKEGEDGKMKPLFVLHSLALSLLLFIVKSKTVFFIVFSILVLWAIVRIFKLLRRIMRKDYSEQEQ